MKILSLITFLGELWHAMTNYDFDDTHLQHSLQCELQYFFCLLNIYNIKLFCLLEMHIWQ